MATYLALLRGINLGSVNKVSMPELRTLFESLGHSDVRTYVQSGNVVFEASSSASKKLAREIEEAIERTFGLAIPAVLRTRAQLQRVAVNNPFMSEGVKPTFLHVMFLAETPSSTAVRALDPDRSPPDKFAVKGREIYLCFPRGSGRSKLTIDYFEKKLGTRATGRNWNTVTKVLALMDDSRRTSKSKRRTDP